MAAMMSYKVQTFRCGERSIILLGRGFDEVFL